MIFFGLAEVIQPDVVFLTDCGTIYRADCLTRLLLELYNKRDKLAGVTARQRVMDQTRAEEVSEDSLLWKSDRTAPRESELKVRFESTAHRHKIVGGRLGIV